MIILGATHQTGAAREDSKNKQAAMAALNDVQRQFILRRLAMNMPPPIVVNQFNGQWGGPAGQPGNLTNLDVARFDPNQGAFLNPIDAAFFEKARAEHIANPNKVDWSDPNVQVEHVGHFAADCHNRGDGAGLLNYLREIRDIKGNAAGGDNKSSDTTVEWIIRPMPEVKGE